METFWRNWKFLFVNYFILIYLPGLIQIYKKFLCSWRLIIIVYTKFIEVAHLGILYYFLWLCLGWKVIHMLPVFKGFLWSNIGYLSLESFPTIIYCLIILDVLPHLLLLFLEYNLIPYAIVLQRNTVC